MPANATQPTEPDQGDHRDCNVALVAGALSSRPRRRELPSGDTLLQLDVSTRDPGTSAAHSVPAVWFSPPEWAIALDAGDCVIVVGTVRRRFFKAGGATMSRTEVVVERAAPRRARRRAERVVEAARAALDDAAG